MKNFDFLNLHNEQEFQDWREKKLGAVNAISTNVVKISNLRNPKTEEIDAIIRQCEARNFCIYDALDHGERDQYSADLRSFADSFGLDVAEDHRSAGKNGVVDLKISNENSKSIYIPYSNKAMNWHTDGYYNAPKDRIRSFVLHCLVAADDGGTSQLCDPEIVYIKLRDENPDFIAALAAQDALTIPENIEPNGKIRPKSVGPVFSVEPKTNLIEMRYTARKRYIEWNDEPTTMAAVNFLSEVLATEGDHITTVDLRPGQGVICNNCLHNRTSFGASGNRPSARHLLRARFHNRIARKQNGKA